jgi:hypothetical protein
VAANPMPEHLSDVHNLALIVRLVVTKDGRLVHGEILDAGDRGRGKFRTWSELAAALQACVEAASPGESSPPNSF